MKNAFSSLLLPILFVAALPSLSYASSCPEGQNFKTEDTPDGVDKGCERLEKDEPFREGLWTSFDADGKKAAERHFVRGQLHGRLTIWHSNGKKRSEAHFHQGEEHGESKAWNEDGSLFYEQAYEFGKPHGTWTHHYGDGGRKIETYQNGKPEGVWKEIDGKGNVLAEEIYKNGALVSSQSNSIDKGAPMESRLDGIEVPESFLLTEPVAR